MNVTKHLLVRGRVQGVNYRESMRSEARRLGVTGWVRNLDDGSVESVVHGPAEIVEKLIAWARRGPPAARVDSLQISETTGEFATFERLP